MSEAYFLQRMARLSHIGIFCQTDGDLKIYCDSPEYNPIYNYKGLREELIRKAEKQDEPYIYRDEYMVYFACIKKRDSFFLIGPMSIELLSRIDLYHYYKKYCIKTEQMKALKKFRFPEILDIIELIEGVLTENEYEDEALVQANNLVQNAKKQEMQEKVIFELKENEEALYHHTYQEERKLLDCVRDGRVKEALHYNRSMDVDLGKLSEKEANHWKNAAIVGITLCTRAAIEGGISPAIAYNLSDFYIQKCDGCKDVEQLLEYRNRAVEDLTTRVYERMQKAKSSNYVESCRDYINRHYREKIYLDDIAEALGISAGHLSRIFHAETNIRLQDYIIQVRVEHAGNLLMYSEESIADIAEYVNFPSQSYMGRMFKTYKGMTPREYREKYKPREFSSN